MRFELIDEILEQDESRILAIKHVTLAEEYLADHFPGFPILPGVLMLEVLVQAARRLLADRSPQPLVLGQVKAVKYGAMVRPGQSLLAEVTLKSIETADDGSLLLHCRGSGRVVDTPQVDADAKLGAAADAPTAVSGRFTLRQPRIAAVDAARV